MNISFHSALIHLIYRCASRSRLFAVACLLATVQTALADDEVIRVTCRVTQANTNETLFGVNVKDLQTGNVRQTNNDGICRFEVRANTTLQFSYVGAAPVTVKVKGRTEIEVSMVLEDISLGEAQATVKRRAKEVSVQYTQAVIKGNYYYINTLIRVPRKVFGTDTRLVMQPIVNNRTRKTMLQMPAIVLDGKSYHATQERMYDFASTHDDSLTGDPLSRYVSRFRVRTDSLRGEGKMSWQDIIPYNDSVYIENPNDEFFTDAVWTIEDYRKIRLCDTRIISRGNVRPLRWLDYDFAAAVITDSTLFPRPEKQLRATNGEVNLRFPIERAEFDLGDAVNAAEMARLTAELHKIENMRDASLDALTLYITSSPDGRYESNLKLARRRLDYAMNYLASQLSADTRQRTKFASKASVASWSEAADLLEADSLTEEAARIREVMRRYPKSVDSQSRAISKLPFYGLLKEKYLPRLRSIKFAMNYSIYRQMTLGEIKALYAQDSTALTEFEYFTLARGESDPGERERILRQAVRVYPSLIVSANDLQALLIGQNRPEKNLLKPFAGKQYGPRNNRKDTPLEVNFNHAVALIDHGAYSAADSIADFLPDQPETKLLKAVTGALNDRLDENFDIIAATGPRNKICLLLAMKRDKEALELCDELPDSLALTHYLRATCLNRLEKSVEAEKELKKAIKMDPALETEARNDGDVEQLLEEKKRMQK